MVDKKLNEYIRILYELANSEVAPVTVAESHRRTKIPLSWCSWCLKYLHEVKKQLKLTQLPMEYKESSPLPPRYQEYAVREIWSDAKFYFGDLVEEERVNEKIELFRKLSRIGLSMARMSEDALTEACLRITKKLTKSTFNSPYPDIVMEVDGKKLCVEVSIRYENPIDFNYIKRKRKLAPEDYDLLIIAPKFSKQAWKKYKAKIVVDINLERYPTKFPLWKEYSAFVDDFKKFARKVEVIDRSEYTDRLESIVRQYV